MKLLIVSLDSVLPNASPVSAADRQECQLFVGGLFCPHWGLWRAIALALGCLRPISYSCGSAESCTCNSGCNSLWACTNPNTRMYIPDCLVLCASWRPLLLLDKYATSELGNFEMTEYCHALLSLIHVYRSTTRVSSLDVCYGTEIQTGEEEQRISSRGGNLFDCPRFLSWIQLQEIPTFSAHSSSENLFRTHFLWTNLENFLLGKLAEICSYLLQNNFKS